MPSPAPLLDIAAARRLVVEYVGKVMQVTACWQPPQGIYRVTPDDCNFAVVDPGVSHVGGPRHVAVDRRNGTITEAGCIGD